MQSHGETPRSVRPVQTPTLAPWQEQELQTALLPPVPQGLRFGFPDAVEGFGEDDGQDGGSDAGDGAQDADGLPVFHDSDPVDGLIDFGPDLLDFGVDGLKPLDDPSGGSGGGATDQEQPHAQHLQAPRRTQHLVARRTIIRPQRRRLGGDG